ncbi:MAG: type II secretion system protein [Phycisphaerae bacterium]|nr:type II secretion system protein [Phycisphaerae bacterium]
MPGTTHRQRHPHRGFTLIEILVVVSVIALLIAILIPALTRAREQSRTVVCLSHLQQIGSATGMYMSQNRDWYPIGPADKIFAFTDNRQTYRYIEGNCIWGGRRGSLHFPQVEWYNRPLSKFMYAGVPSEDRVGVFECPSDKGTPLYELTMGRSIYHICGNSYYMNTHGEFARKSQKSRSHPATIVMYEEGNLHFLLGDPRTLPWPAGRAASQGRGWHGRKNRFNVGFLDFHAAEVSMDPRKLSGPGWNVKDFFRIWGWIEE